MKLDGYPMKFGDFPRMVFSEETFSLKMLLYSWSEHAINSHALLVDLTKSHDIIKHKVTSISFKNMDAPGKHLIFIEKLYEDFNIVLKIVKEELIIECVCRVKFKKIAN